MKPTVLVLPVAILVPALLALAPGAADGRTHASPSVVVAERAPTSAMTAGLCGLTSSDASDIINHYGFEDAEMNAISDALATPFDCDAYGDLCDALGETDAHNYACGVWGDLEAHVVPATVISVAVDRIQSWGDPCEPSELVCANVCSPRDVWSCVGFLLGGTCVATPTCGSPVGGLDIPFFTPILGVFPETPPTV
ncbi:MAG: hypothetical protein K0V04_31500 [Deltaproteobacteria bacterium]|nr:hypothetical protein [Deltaproteobacteria bacterium]